MKCQREVAADREATYDCIGSAFVPDEGRHVFNELGFGVSLLAGRAVTTPVSPLVPGDHLPRRREGRNVRFPHPSRGAVAVG